MCSEQDMIENVLEIKGTHVREVMTPLVDVVAIDGSATLVEFQNLWATHQYSRLLQFASMFQFLFNVLVNFLHKMNFRVPVFEERIDNIVGIAYAMDMLEYVKKVGSM